MDFFKKGKGKIYQEVLIVVIKYGFQKERNKHSKGARIQWQM